MLKVLLVDDDDAFADSVARYLSQTTGPAGEETEVAVAASAEEVRDLLQFYNPKFIISDFDLGAGEPNGVQLLSEVSPAITKILWSGLDRSEEVRTLTAAGYSAPDHVLVKNEIEKLMEILG